MIEETPDYGKVVGVVEFQGKVIVAAEYGVFELLEDDGEKIFKQIEFAESKDNG